MPMLVRRVCQAVSWLALAGTIVPAALFLAGSIDLPQTKLLILIAGLVWFVVTPLWMGREPKQQRSASEQSG